MSRRLVAVLLAATAVLPWLAACGDDAAADPGTSVVASFYPLQYVTQRVAGHRLEVANLTSPGVEPHDLELGVRQTAEVARADLVVYERGLQPAVDLAVEQNASGRSLDVLDAVRLKPYADDPAAGQDPHFWQDPVRMARLGDAVAERLTALDPRHAAAYQRHAADLRADLERLDADFRTGLAHCAVHTVVVSHDAFGYLTRYGLRFVSIAGLTPAAEASPDHIAQIQRLVASEGLTTVFSEELASPKMAQTIAHDTGVRSAVLDPLEGLADATSGKDYLALMRDNLAALKEANQCT